MSSNVLYFPYMRAPENDWFARVLLYWDKVGFILPEEYIEKPQRLGEYTVELMSEDLIKPISPGEYIRKIPNFSEPFLEMLKQNPEILKRQWRAIADHQTFRIHMEKFTPVAFYLEDLGLAKISKYPWYEVESLTADLYMAYLASALGKCEDLNMTPITDETPNLSVFLKSPEEKNDSKSIIDQLRVSVLDNTLPAPQERPKPKALAEFKENNFELLKDFRLYIEEALSDIAFIENPQQRQIKIDLFQQRLNLEKEKIAAKMKEQHWSKLTFGTCAGLMAAAIPALKASVGGNVSEALIAAPGLISAIYLAYKGRKDRQEEILSSPLAYVVMAQKKLKE